MLHPACKYEVSGVLAALQSLFDLDFIFPSRKKISVWYPLSIIGKISVYRHCFCYSNLPAEGTKDLLF